MVRWFVDRSLGSRVVPDALREAGWSLVTMDERYGPDRSQSVSDSEWIADATGEILLTSDKKIGKVPIQARVIRATSARIVVVDASVRAVSQIERLKRHHALILDVVAHREGPWIMSAGASRLTETRLASSDQRAR